MTETEKHPPKELFALHCSEIIENSESLLPRELSEWDRHPHDTAQLSVQYSSSRFYDVWNPWDKKIIYDRQPFAFKNCQYQKTTHPPRTDVLEKRLSERERLDCFNSKVLSMTFNAVWRVFRRVGVQCCLQGNYIKICVMIATLNESVSLKRQITKSTV